MPAHWVVAWTHGLSVLAAVLDGLAARFGARRLDARRTICLDDSQHERRGCLMLLFEEGRSEPSLVAKAAPLGAARRRGDRPIYEIEHENLEQLVAHGLNAEAPTVPEPLAAWSDRGLLVTVQRALTGPPMKNLHGKRLFSSAALGETLDRVLGWTTRFEQSFGARSTVLDASLYGRWVLAPLEAFLDRFDTEPSERELLVGRLARERRLAGATLPFTVRHGDFCPANVAWTETALGVFDWEFPLEHRPPLFDLFHFLASTRFPFSGPRGESSHFDSFRKTYWGQSYFAREARARIWEAARSHRIPSEHLGDLFLLALLDIANLKYEALIEIHGESGTGTGGGSAWERAGGTDKDAPFARVRAGAFENMRWVARAGLPRFEESRVAG